MEDVVQAFMDRTPSSLFAKLNDLILLTRTGSVEKPFNHDSMLQEVNEAISKLSSRLFYSSQLTLSNFRYLHGEELTSVPGPS